MSVLSEILQSVVGVQLLTASSGTYTPTAGTRSAILILQAAGGGGGGVGTTAGTGIGGAGGAGETRVYVLTQVAGTYPYTISVLGQNGTGGASPTAGSTAGDTTFGTGPLVTAKGGTGGGSSTGATVGSPDGATPATGSGGILLPPTAAAGGIQSIIGMARTGIANSLFGQVIMRYGTTGSTAGADAAGYGAGGGGGLDFGTAGAAGGDGSAGMILVLELT